MIRLLLIVLLICMLCMVLATVIRSARARTIDWTGVTFAVGFVVMAFWLRHVTGIG